MNLPPVSRGRMNANYPLAGTVSTNPTLFILATWLVLAWRGAVGVPGHVERMVGEAGLEPAATSV